MNILPVIFCYLLLLSGFALARCKRGRCLMRCEDNDGIVGGKDTDISDVPYQAAFLWNDYYYCGGAIISEKYVLTGAHCVWTYLRGGEDVSSLMIRVGSNHSYQGGLLIKAKNSTCHPKFDDENYDYDVCLIELSQPLKFNKNIQPVKIGNVEPKDGQFGKVAGWGTLWAGGSEPKVLQSVMVPITNRTYCEEAYKKICPVTERMFCAGEEGKDSCQGDSGGGLVVEKTLVGVVSSGYGCGFKGYPGVYTNLAHSEIRKFIKDNAKL